MGLFRKLECRHMVIDAKRTSIALEPEFWVVADKKAKAEGVSWHEWALHKLSKVDESRGRASVLRVAILRAVHLCHMG